MHRWLIICSLLALSLTFAANQTPVAGQEATPDAAACPTTTEEENIATATIWHEEAINQRDPAALLDILAPDVIHHSAGGYLDTMTATEVESMMAEFPAAFSDLEITFDFWLADGDMVVERYTATGTHDGPLGDLEPTNRTITWTGINIFRIECGLIAEVWSEVDALSRMAQLTGDAEAAPAP